jgi:hypothetical protein
MRHHGVLATGGLEAFRLRLSWAEVMAAFSGDHSSS